MSERHLLADVFARIANITARKPEDYTTADDPIWLALADRVIANRKPRR